jgi:hypothetical protein
MAFERKELRRYVKTITLTRTEFNAIAHAAKLKGVKMSDLMRDGIGAEISRIYSQAQAQAGQ